MVDPRIKKDLNKFPTIFIVGSMIKIFQNFFDRFWSHNNRNWSKFCRDQNKILRNFVLKRKRPFRSFRNILANLI